MTQRATDERLVAALDQVRALEEAQAAYVRLLWDAPDNAREERMIAELYQRINASRRYAGLLIRHFMGKLDPYGDIYEFQPAEPIELTANGIIPRTSGFSNYTDMVTVQDIPGGAIFVVENNKYVVNETQKPDDVASFYHDQRIWVEEGDAIAIRAQVTLMPNDPGNIASTATIGMSLTGQNVIFPQSFVLNGFGSPIVATYSTTAYAGPNWARDGAQVVVQADGPVRITNRTLLITRLHKARSL